MTNIAAKNETQRRNNEKRTMNYEQLEIPNGVPVKMWTKGVPVEAEAQQQLANALTDQFDSLTARLDQAAPARFISVSAPSWLAARISRFCSSSAVRMVRLMIGFLGS